MSQKSTDLSGAFYKFPIPHGGKKIIFNLKGKKISAYKFLFAKYSNIFHNVENLKLNEYTIDLDVSEDSLKSFISACQGEPFAITSDNIYDMYLLSNEFDTPSIKSEIEIFYENNEVESLVKSILNDKKRPQSLFDSAASRFAQIIKDTNFLKIKLNDIQKILQNPKINISNSLDFYEFVKNYYFAYPYDKKDASVLFQYVNLIELPIDKIIEFASLEITHEELFSKNILPFIKKICLVFQDQQKSIQKISQTLQQAATEIVNIKQKLEETNKINSELLERNKNFEVEYQEKIKLCQDFQEQNKILLKQVMENNIKNAELNNLKGVFYDITMKSKDINSELEFILPTTENPEFPVFNLIDTSANFLSMPYYLKVEKPEDNWLTFHLLKNKIKLYGFSIRTNEIGSTIAHPKKFQILGSNDNENFTELFSFDDCKQELYNPGKTIFFPIDFEVHDEYYSYIRYRQFNGHCPYYDNDRIIALSAMELFGILIPNN